MLAIQGWSRFSRVFQKVFIISTIMLSCEPRGCPEQQKGRKEGTKETDKRAILAPMLLMGKEKEEKQSHSTCHLWKNFLARLPLSYIFSVLKIPVLWRLLQVSPETAALDQQNVMSSHCSLDT